MAKNLVLYALADGIRAPLLSLDVSAGVDRFAPVKIGQKVGEAMRAAEARGVASPDFAAVIEERSADESGRVVVSASFRELDPVSLSPVGEAFQTLPELFKARAEAAKKASPADAPDPAAERSAALSV